jgi:hypothetical protein
MIFFIMTKGRFFFWALATVIAACTVLLVGCSTTESRISEHRDLYASLPPRQQQFVAQGQIAPGMSQSAVWLAWGSPGQKVSGFARGHATETWVYFGYANADSYGYGYGYGGYGRFGYGYPFYGGGAGVFRTHHGHRFVVFGDPFYDPFYFSYIPPTVQYPDKTVTFVNDRVAAFQHLVTPYRY